MSFDPARASGARGPHDPSNVDVRLTIMFGYTLASSFYRGFVQRMQLAGHESVLEVGPGCGALSRHLAAALQRGGGRLTCLDISRVWLEVASGRLKRYRNIDWILGDVTCTPLNRAAFDRVVMHFVLHDIGAGDRISTVKSLADSLRPGGRLHIREPINLRFQQALEGRAHGMTPQEIEDIMQACGLKSERSQVERHFLIGSTYEAAYAKQSCDHVR